jgi:hypothetical protein
MSTTTIKRKALRNRVKAKRRKAEIKLLTAKPALKNVDIEVVKSTFKNQENKKLSEKLESVEQPENKVELKQAAEVKEEIKDVAKTDESKPGKSTPGTKDKVSRIAPSRKVSTKKKE